MDTIKNDDAVVDCIVYTCESDEVPMEQRVKLTRKVVDFDPSGKECSITMCGSEDDPEAQMLKYCEHGHCIHSTCLEYIFENAESLSTAVCPQCRSSRMMTLVLKARPIEGCQFSEWFNPQAMASDIIDCAEMECTMATPRPVAFKTICE